MTASLGLGLSALHAQSTTMHDYDNGLDNRSIIAKIGTNHEYITDEIDHSVANLGKRGTDEIYFSGMPDASWGSEGAYIEVDIKDGGLDFTDATDQDCLLIYVRRNKNEGHANPEDDHINAHPTAFRVVGLFGDDDESNPQNWHELFYTYLLYRGPETQEFSSKVLIKKLWMDMKDHGNDDLSSLTPEVPIDKKLKKMRFYVTANNNRERGNVRGDDGRYLRDMSLARFDVLKVQKTDDYSDTFKDRLHLKSDYSKDFWNYEFKNTRGVIDYPNIMIGWSEEDLNKKSQLPESINIDFPDFNFITSGNSKFPLEADQKRQPTHTVEHIIYAIPGDVVALYPYYQMHEEKIIEYQENFSHWYDYRTGGRMTYAAPWSNLEYELLDFATDPSEIQMTKNHGFFGGKKLTTHKIVVTTPQEYIDAVNEANNENPSSYIVLGADLDFSTLPEGTQVPMLGDGANTFTGYLNGNGHRISNLKLSYSAKSDVGIIARSGNGARIENLIIDKTCQIEGNSNVGLIGYHDNQYLYVRNIHTEATVIGHGNNNLEPNAAGLVGFGTGDANRIQIENCYIGGTIGKEGTSANTAIVASTGTSDIRDNINSAWCKNVIVDCKLYARANEKYYHMRSSGIVQFQNCYGNQHTCGLHQGVNSLVDALGSDIDNRDWSLLKGFENWDGKYPDFEVPTDTDKYTKHYIITSVEDYVRVVQEINGLESTDDVYIELQNNLTFGIGIKYPLLGTAEKPFAGFFNGNGHEIRALHLIYPEEEGVGLIAHSADGVRLENLKISISQFIGKRYVGLVGSHSGGRITIRNVSSDATIEGRAESGELCAAGILGHTDSNNCILTLENCYIEGRVGNPDNTSADQNNAAIVGWLGTADVPDNGNQSIFRNVVVKCDVYGAESPEKIYYRNNTGDNTGHIRVVNCYGRLHESLYGTGVSQNFHYIDPNEQNIRKLAGFTGWKEDYPPVETPSYHNGTLPEGSRVTGTYATFFCPRNPYMAAGAQDKLPFDKLGDAASEEEELIIAADFSQEFYNDRHIIDASANGNDEDKNGVIYEPIIMSRHIFRIRDGKTFADEFSGSEANNENFVRKNQRMVSARAGVPFQIRFDNPVPAATTTRSNYYYKLSDDDYRRVCSMAIRVLDGQTREEIDNTNKMFYAGEAFKGRGSRIIDGIKYDLCGGDEAEYYRMLMCDDPEAGNYIVQLIGRDVNGEIIKVYDEDNMNLSDDQRRDLVVMEYHISFLPEAGASMLTESKLYDNGNEYKSARQETLEEQYGTPGVIDFDEYIKLHSLDASLKDSFIYTAYPTETSEPQGEFTFNPFTNTHNLVSSYFKWPVAWDESNYSFGYNARHDYNMYMLATHSQETPFKGAARNFDGNREGDGKGLFDRKYYHTLLQHKEDLKNGISEAEATPVEQGYFYYVNAATDPGVSAKIRIDELCPGSTLHVSAWLAEFSANPETANLSFNFVAVLNDNVEGKDGDTHLKGGDRIKLHSFITGYVPKGLEGQWLHVYYSFVPRLTEFSADGITSEMVDHYELELDNNCKSSDGADYAIDDIRIYISRPEILASQLTPSCGKEPVKILVESPFDTMLQTCGEKEVLNGAGKDVTVLYSFIDKNKFDNIYDETNGEEAFNQSVVRFNYDGRGTGDNNKSTYGRLTFNTRLFNNVEYGKEKPEDIGKASYRTGNDGRDMIVFTSDLTDEDFKVGKEYYVVLHTSLEPNYTIPENKSEWTIFDMMSACAKICTVYVRSSNIVKIDGVLVEEMGQFVVCENQSPVVQVNVWGKQTEGDEEFVEVEKNAIFDWYLGSLEDFTSEGKPSIKESLDEFRRVEKYSTVNSLEDVKPEGDFTKEMLDVLLKASDKLRLYESSYLIPPTTLGEDGRNEVDLVVIPLPGSEINDDNLLICSEPSEITLYVRNKSPKLQHGLAINYPEDMDDVPLRIGLDQLRSTVKEGDNVGFTMKTVEIPVRNASSTDGKVQSLSLITESAWDGKEMTPGKTGCIVLVETDDKEYEDLGTIGLDKDNKEYDTDHLLWVGEVNKLTASTAEGAQENLFDVEFDKNFNFKEGYYYRMRFQYSESKESSEEDENEEVVCNGHDVFTLKIVPKYLQWTGNTDAKGNSNLNWNNDANWKRVTASDLYAKEKIGDPDYRHHVTDGMEGNSDVNGREKSFAPLDFTYVIIPAEPEAPYLYSAATKEVTVQRTGVTDTYDWSEDPKENNNGYGDYPEAGVGDHTNRIHYDMAACDLTNYADAATGCRPWYMNTCNEIHFLPGASIMNQQELVYNKAWVDVELDPQRWYTLASPLQEVYAGDFYLPSASGRQETELYNDITFGKDINNRFKPAVYQRGWDKSTARVYEIGGPGIDDSGVRNVMVKANWSNVYNDVKELYGGGTGFSIKADVTAMESQPANNKVLFRLPKADTSFDYFNLDGTTSGHNTPITRSADAYRLNDLTKKITATTAQEGQYFLIGNPFMTYMDIRRFIESNPDLEQMFWIVTANGQIAGTIGDAGVVTTGPTEEGQDLTVMAPMQGFFVKSKQPATEVDLSYDKTMMRRNGADKPMLKAPAMSDEETAMLRITAVNDGETTSSAVLATGYGDSGMNNVEAIDNRSLGIPSTVYTIGGGQALSINFADTAEGTEIGVAADSDAMTTLRFEVPETMEDLSLLDKADYSLTPLYDGMEISVEGAAAGRFFLTHGNNVEEVYGGLEWAVDNSGLTVSDQASTGRLSVKVYDTVGRRIASEATGADSIRIDLAQGVYVVEITNGNETKSIKIRI